DCRIKPTVTHASLRKMLDAVLDRWGYSYKVSNGALCITPNHGLYVAQMLTVGRRTPVAALRSRRDRDLWRVVRATHPRGRLGGWYLVLGWTPGGLSCGPIDPRTGEPADPVPVQYHFFMRECGSNHALSLDWALPRGTVSRRTRCDVGSGPSRLPECVTRRPRIGSREGWARVRRVIASTVAAPRAAYARPRAAVLRIVRDEGDWNRLRLVWHYAPFDSAYRVSVDANTGEVGGIESVPTESATTARDPLEELSRHGTRWIPTEPARKPGPAPVARVVLLREPQSAGAKTASAGQRRPSQMEGRAAGPETTPAQEDSALLSFAIFHKLLANKNGTPFAGARGYVLERDTILLRKMRDWLSFPMHRRRRIRKEDQEAFHDFAARNAAPAKSPRLDIGVPITVAPRPAIDAAFAADGWRSFYKRFPKASGLLSVSLPGYSADRKTALVYVTWRAGPLAGLGELSLFSMRGDRWTCKESLAGWQN
ncbi:MAG TPA: hypothetical protein VKT77_05705, partial [Chthonomonadaceae bacterium]|nr:hypothetical protein [Chthonomonadaceae bacterium]